MPARMYKEVSPSTPQCSQHHVGHSLIHDTTASGGQHGATQVHLQSRGSKQVSLAGHDPGPPAHARRADESFLHLSGGAMRSSMSSMIWLDAASASASGQDGTPSPPPSAARLIRPTRTSLRPHSASMRQEPRETAQTCW